MLFRSMSAGNFSDAASPRGSHGVAQANAKHLSEWQKSPNSQSITSRLPIGPSSPAATAGTAGGPKGAPPRIGPSRVRQHHYPRHGSTNPVTSLQQALPTPNLQHAPSASGSIASPKDSYEQKQESTEAKEIEQPAQDAGHDDMAVNISVLSNTSSTRTQWDSLTLPLSRPVSSKEVAESVQRSSQKQALSHHSYDSNFLPSDSSREVGDSNSDVEGEVQTASRVLDTTAPLMTRFGDAERPTVVGLATAVLVRSKSTDLRAAEQIAQNHRHLDASIPTSGFEPETFPPSLGPLPFTDFLSDFAAEQKTQNHQHLDASSPMSGFEPETSAPPSPRHPPSIDSPPSHRTDIPESARSIPFSEEVYHPKHLPYDEVTGQGFTFWDLAQSARSNVEPSTVSKDRSFNNASSIKTVVSYITTKSKSSTIASKVTKVSHRSHQSTASSRWAWWKKKPLPPLPPPSPLSLNNLGSVSNDQGGQQLHVHNERIGGSSPILEPGQYQRSKVELVGQGEPQGWRDIADEKMPGLTNAESETHESAFVDPIGKSVGRIDILGVDSLKMAGRKFTCRRNGFKENGASPYNSADDPPFRRILKSFRSLVTTKCAKWVGFSLIGIVILAIILGAVLGTTLRHNHSNGSSSCSGNQTGVRCNLGA